MKAIIWIAVFLMCAMALVAQESGSAQSVAAPGGQATLADFKGEVTVRFEDQTTPAAARGMALPANAILETGKKGSALLGMKDGSQVLVRSNTRVQIKATEDSQGHWFELLIGKIRAKVRKHLGEQAPFRLGTPSAVITVRGTDFVVEVND